MARRSRRSVLIAMAVASTTLGGCSLPSMGGNDPYTPTAVVVENRTRVGYTVAIAATDGPRLPQTTVGIEPARATGSDEDALTVIAGFFTEPGRYDIEARTNTGATARAGGIELRRTPDGGLDGQVPAVVIDADDSLHIVVHGNDPPPMSSFTLDRKGYARDGHKPDQYLDTLI